MSKKKTETAPGTSAETFPHNLNMYSSFPPSTGTTKPTGFEEMVEQRLNLYKLFQTAIYRGRICDDDEQVYDYPPEWYAWMEAEIGKVDGDQLSTYQALLSLSPVGTSTSNNDHRMADNIAHWLLRLAYCDTSERRKTFLKYELQWFQLRVNKMTVRNQLDFINSNRILSRVLQLGKIEPGSKASSLFKPDDVVYKTYFTNAPSLIKRHDCWRKQGFIHFKELVLGAWLLDQFEIQLKNDLIYTAQMKANILDELRHIELILNRVKLVEIKSYSSYNAGLLKTLPKITLADLDSEAILNYPLCMRNSHRVLRTTHHLKYFGRMQYGLFLKGIGLKLDESMELWESELMQKSLPARWKRFRYLINYIYGLVGRRVDHALYTCDNILDIEDIGSGVKSTAGHGCPFKCWDKEELEYALTESSDNELSSYDVKEIIELKSQKRYGEACGKFFEGQMGCKPKVLITQHPNAYYNNSRVVNLQHNIRVVDPNDDDD